MAKLADKLKTTEKLKKQKADDFIKEGASITNPEPPTKEKKYVSYYMDRQLIRKIRVEAAMNDEQPAHVVERVMSKYFEKKKQ